MTIHLLEMMPNSAKAKWTCCFCGDAIKIMKRKYLTKDGFSFALNAETKFVPLK